MTDFHVHIGQFHERYYDAADVFAAIAQVAPHCGIDAVRYSSTSSCRFDENPARCLEELAYAQTVAARFTGISFQPYLWYLPRYAEAGVFPEKALQAFDYCGCKLHPRAQQWDCTNPAHDAALHELFALSAATGLIILLHTGTAPFEVPGRFIPYLHCHPLAHVILAHCRPVPDTIAVLRQFPHCHADTAFVLPEAIRQVRAAGLGDRLVFGSDFPITQFWKQQSFSDISTLVAQYREDCAILETLETSSLP